MERLREREQQLQVGVELTRFERLELARLYARSAGQGLHTEPAPVAFVLNGLTESAQLSASVLAGAGDGREGVAIASSRPGLHHSGRLSSDQRVDLRSRSRGPVGKVVGVGRGMDEIGALGSDAHDSRGPEAAHRVNDNDLAGASVTPIEGRAWRDDLVWDRVVCGHL
jgi:hypothetical protein